MLLRRSYVAASARLVPERERFQKRVGGGIPRQERGAIMSIRNTLEYWNRISFIGMAVFTRQITPEQGARETEEADRDLAEFHATHTGKETDEPPAKQATRNGELEREMAFIDLHGYCRTPAGAYYVSDHDRNWQNRPDAETLETVESQSYGVWRARFTERSLPDTLPIEVALSREFVRIRDRLRIGLRLPPETEIAMSIATTEEREEWPKPNNGRSSVQSAGRAGRVRSRSSAQNETTGNGAPLIPIQESLPIAM